MDTHRRLLGSIEEDRMCFFEGVKAIIALIIMVATAFFDSADRAGQATIIFNPQVNLLDRTS